MRFPNCCGSEDGQVVYGTDSTRDCSVMIAMWMCNTCGVTTVVSDIQICSTNGPPAL